MSKEFNLFEAEDTADDDLTLELPFDVAPPVDTQSNSDEPAQKQGSEEELAARPPESSPAEAPSKPVIESMTEPATAPMVEASHAPELSTPSPVEEAPKAVKGTHLERMIGKIQERKDRENSEIELVEKGKRIIEALLFASNEPLSFNRIRDIIEVKHPIKPRHLKQALTDLRDDYIQQDRAFRLEEVGNGYLLRSCEEYSIFIDQIYRNRRTEKLSHAATEVLAIIAHRQPITRPQIDAIRGVDSSGTVAALVERGLIEGVGRLEAPGRPTLYGVTQDFLKYFGLKTAGDLPVEEAASIQGS